MSNVVLFHQGCAGPFIDSPTLPDYLRECIEQYSTFNDGKVYVMTDRGNRINLARYAQAIPVILEDYYSDKISRFCSLYDHSEKDFWTVSITRFFYLENLMRERNLQHVFHFENDVLIYFNVAEQASTFERLYENIAITPCDHNKSMTGFMYVNDYKSLESMTDFFIEALTELGLKGTQQRYGLDMVNEMGLMAAYHKERGSDHIAHLPILPFGSFSRNYNDFNSIFDPASWGQFVGGTRTEGPGAKPLDHYIGRLLRANPQYKVVWKVEDGLKLPYFHYDNNLVKINNLHIHSKNLAAFVSRDRSLRKARHIYDGFSSHQPVLYEAVKRTEGAVLELGCGYGSTPMLHELCKKEGRKLLSLESNEEWLQQFSEYETSWHRFTHVTDWDTTLDRISTEEYDVVFVDQDPYEARVSAIKVFKDKAKFIVLHDCHWFPEGGFFGKSIRKFGGPEDIGRRTYDDLFEYSKEFCPPGAYGRQYSEWGPTLLASNFESCNWDIDYGDYELAESLLR